MMTLKKPLFMAAFVVFVFALSQTTVLAGGGGPEPGAACNFDGKYAPPPYLGNATVTLTYHDPHGEGDAWYYQISGVLNQAGTDCTLTFTDTWYKAENVEEFDGLKGNMLRGICLEITTNVLIAGCSPEQYFETVGVGALKYSGDGDEFSAHFVIMMLQ